MSWLSKLFGGHDNSAMDAANQYLNQISGVAHQGYDPYVNQGREASGRTQQTYEELMKDPTAFINKLMEGYKPSEGYNYQKELLQRELGNTAAAGGFAGTALDQENQGTAIQKLLSGDMQQFLNNILGVFNTGLKGEEGIAGRGYNATQQLTDTLGNSLNQQGGLAFQNQQQQNQNRSDLFKIFGQMLGGGVNAAGKITGII
jgi:hypothetical protein